MYVLLKNGHIRCGAPARSEDGALRGSVVVDLKPGDPNYRKSIRFLDPDDRARATRLAEIADRHLLAK